MFDNFAELGKESDDQLSQELSDFKESRLLNFSNNADENVFDNKIDRSEQDDNCYIQFEILKSKDLLKMEISEFPYLVDKLIPERAITSITADSGKGKSLIALQIADCVSRGVKLFGEFKTKKKKVLYIDQEMDRDLIIDRLRSMLDENSDIDFMIEQFWHIDNPEHYEEILNYIKAKEYGLVVFDTLTTIHGSDENLSKEMRAINELMLKLIKETNVTIIYLHHHRKQGKGESYNQSSSRGSTEIIAKVASHLLIDSKRKVDDCGVTCLEMIISQEKSRRPDGINKIRVNIFHDSLNNKTAFDFVGDVDQISESTQRAEEFITETLRENPGRYSIKELLKKAETKDGEVKEGAIRKACKALLEKKIIEKIKGDGSFWNTDYFYMPRVD